MFCTKGGQLKYLLAEASDSFFTLTSSSRNLNRRQRSLTKYLHQLDAGAVLTPTAVGSLCVKLLPCSHRTAAALPIYGQPRSWAAWSRQRLKQFAESFANLPSQYIPNYLVKCLQLCLLSLSVGNMHPL